MTVAFFTGIGVTLIGLAMFEAALALARLAINELFPRPIV